MRSNSKTNVKKSSNNDAEQPQEETSEDPSQLSEKDRAALEKLIMFKNKGFITDLELEWKKKELFRKSKPKPPTSKAPPKIQTPSTPILLPEPSPPNTPVSVETPEISVDTPDTSTTNDSPMILVSSLDMDEVLQKIEEEKVKLRLQVNQGTIKEKDFDYEVRIITSLLTLVVIRKKTFRTWRLIKCRVCSTSTYFIYPLTFKRVMN